MPSTVIHAIAEEWFLKEPAFYSLLCLQQLNEDPHISCPMRCGEGRIDYNPILLSSRPYREVERLLRIEMIRLFLKHPYQRRPEGCTGEVISKGSDCTIADGYCLLSESKQLQGPDFYHLPMGQCYEWYCKALQQKDDDNDDDNENDNENENGNGKQSRKDQSALWNDDQLMQLRINDLIERTSDWGTIPQELVSVIQASTRARLDSRLVMQGFRSSLLSTNRVLTRMRPNRRSGFLQMGSRRTVQARVLIAIDVSASITDEDLVRFYSTVNRLFRDTDIQIDTLQFDAVTGPVEPFTHIARQVTVTGRGGTNFQPVIDLVCSSKKAAATYDGLIILTDGEAPVPDIPRQHPSILWVCTSQEKYNSSHRWMQQSGRACVM